MMKYGVTSLTTGRVLTGTQQAVSLHRRNATEDETKMIEICATSSTAEMYMTGLKTGIRSVSASNRSSVKKRTMTTMVPITTNLIDSILLKGGTMQEESRLFPMTWRGCVGPWTSNHRGLRSMMGPPT
jgi:hypothetical protein